MKTLRKQRNVVVVLCIVMCGMMLAAGCSRKQETQADMMPPVPSAQTEADVIELSDESRLSDVLQEGDIPEEDRSSLSWLPNRPPQGMQFEHTTELQTVYFEFDKYSLTAEARNILNANAAWLREHPNVSVQLEGHCDERGTLEYNQVLGENRAMSVKKYLVSLGIVPARLYTISYGETMPAAPGHNEEAWAQNRRAEFKIAR